MHYKSEDEARQKWESRCRRVNFRRLFFKVDFGRPHFTQRDIVWWNQLALPNAIALLNDSWAGMLPSVHQGVYVPDWELNGKALYNVSKQYFSLSKWVNAGTLRKPRRDLLLDLLLFNRRFHH